MKNNELKKVGIKNCRCFNDIIFRYSFNDIIKINDFGCNTYFIWWKIIYENILIYGVLYKTLIGAKPLHVMFNKVDRFIRDYTKYLALFDLEIECHFHFQ